MRKYLGVFLVVLLSVSVAQAQRAEVTIQLNEQFFDALLDAIFNSQTPLEFPLAGNDSKLKIQNSKNADHVLAIKARNSLFSSFNGNSSPSNVAASNLPCNESIRLQREIDGVRTAVRFRDGKIYAPLAFSGNYNPPLVGCIGFSGWAETNIELEFDQNNQRLIGRAIVTNVSLSGTGGVGGSFLTKLVQSAIDKRVNPIQILQTDKISFVVPIQNSGSLRMKAVAIRPDIQNGVLNVRVVYEFQKS